LERGAAFATAVSSAAGAASYEHGGEGTRERLAMRVAEGRRAVRPDRGGDRGGPPAIGPPRAHPKKSKKNKACVFARIALGSGTVPQRALDRHATRATAIAIGLVRPSLNARFGGIVHRARLARTRPGTPYVTR